MTTSLVSRNLLVKLLVQTSAFFACLWGGGFWLCVQPSLATARACSPEAQEVDDEKDDKETDEEEPEDSVKPRRKRAQGPSDRETKILDLFNASRKEFLDGRIVLEYDFETREEALADDWVERLEASMKSRIHWATSGELDLLSEGSSSSTSTRSSLRMLKEAIVLSDFGQWTHKAQFLSDVEVSVTLVSVAQPRAGTILGPSFYSSKKKTSLCASSGAQAVLLKGGKPSRTPIPKEEKLLPWRIKQTLSLRHYGKRIECFRNAKKSCDTSADPKFTEGMDVGHAALNWSGGVKCFVAGVDIIGRLDPDWVAEKLGEKPSTTGPKKSGGSGKN